MWLFGKGSKSPNRSGKAGPANWRMLERESQLEEVKVLSGKRPVVIFKHSTRCSTSAIAKFRLESGWSYSSDEAIFYFLDLIRFRNISNRIETEFGVRHESPQLLVIINGKCEANTSHLGVSAKLVAPFVKGVASGNP